MLTDQTAIPGTKRGRGALGTRSGNYGTGDFRETHTDQRVAIVDSVALPHAVPAGCKSRAYAFCKRTFDIMFASLLILLSLPLCLIVAILIKATSLGPVLFRQTRVGRNRATFTCLKFRSMSSDAYERLHHDDHLRERFHLNWKLKDDPRVTPIGRLLRKTSIDEIPQLLNILRGEMSIVGPRPVQVKELEQQYGELGAIIVSVKPGLTGLWQVSGRSSLAYEDRVKLDIEYVNQRCFLLDFRIVLKTIPVVMLGRNAS